jgi:hypothetical protein
LLIIVDAQLACCLLPAAKDEKRQIGIAGTGLKYFYPVCKLPLSTPLQASIYDGIHPIADGVDVRAEPR